MIFFAVVLVSYFLLGRSQNSRLYMLVAASLFFYIWAGFFDTLIFLFVVVVSWVAVWMAENTKSKKLRKPYLAAGIVIMTLHLFFWKYVPWLCATIQSLYPNFLGGKEVRLALPIGISFFTLQGIAYLIDYGRNQAKYVGLKDYLLFKSFFPQLVAGPIVRMSQIGPQLRNLPPIDASNFRSGMLLFAFGFFKKVAIADRMATLADPVFGNPTSYTAGSIFLALLAYSVQIWGDFSGYTDMGRGAAKMLNIHLPENFFSPYLSKGPSEFWRRWHVTLSTWIKDYIYIPLGGSSGGALRVAVVVVVTMAISGLWHGAAFTFMLWGFYHGALLAMERLAKRWNIPIFTGRFAGIITFTLVLFGWLIFRSESMGKLKSSILIMAGALQGGDARIGIASVSMGIGFCFLVQYLGYISLSGKEEKPPIRPFFQRLLQGGSTLPEAVLLGAAAAMIIVLSLLIRVGGVSHTFIYFQF